MQLNRRQTVIGLTLLPQLAACEPDRATQIYAEAASVQKRFKGLGAVLVVDAVPGAAMYGVEMFADGAARPFYGSSVNAENKRDTMAYPGGVLVPMQVRVVWRKTDDSYWKDGLIRYSGELAGEYILPIASRIPDDFIEAATASKAAVRLKFRLKPDGVLFGWDMQTRMPTKLGTGVGPLQCIMPGGDFLDTRC